MRTLRYVKDKTLSHPTVEAGYRWLYERSFKTGKTHHVFRGVFPSFADAAASAPSAAAKGYDNDQAASLYRDRPIFPEDYAVLFWLRSIAASGMTLFDYGGHAGGMFDAFRRYLSLPNGFTWTIFDVPAVVEAGRKLNAARPEPLPLFTTDFADAGRSDILLASGSLQYVEEPLNVRLARLDRLPEHVIVNQVPLHTDYEFFTLQRIGSIFCPYGVFQASRFFESLKSLGYALIDSWSNPKKECYIPTYPRHCVESYSGAYLRRAAG